MIMGLDADSTPGDESEHLVNKLKPYFRLPEYEL
jgi:hypothetical protein